MVDIVDIDTRLIAQRAKALYSELLRQHLERDHLNAFVAIEPVSGEYFIGKTLGDAIDAALEAHPNRVTHTIRIGHDAALEC